MARLSVYISDELLEEARRVVSRSASGSSSGTDTENTSQLVQRGLQCLINSQEQIPAYAQSPDDGHVQIGQLRDRLMAEAKADYAFGYSTALQAASAMSLHTVNALVDVGFDLRRWLKPFQQGFMLQELEKAEPTENHETAKQPLLDATVAISAHDEHVAKKPWWWLFKTAEALGSLADPIGYEAYSFTPTRARERGFIDAMRKLWAAIEEPHAEATSPGVATRQAKSPAAKTPRSSRNPDGVQP